MSPAFCRWATRPWGVAAALILLSSLWAAPRADGRPTAQELYRRPFMEQLVVSPSGDLLAALVQRGGWQRVLVRRRDAPGAVVAFKRVIGIRRIAWIDDDHLAVLMGRRREPTYSVVSVSVRDGRVVTRERPLRARGRFVDLLPSMGDEVLWAVGTSTESSVYRLPIGTLLEVKGRLPEEASRRQRVVRLDRGVVSWVADRHGTVRAAMRVAGSPKQAELWYRPSGEADWRVLVETDDPEEAAHPLGIAENDRDLIVAANGDAERMALFELSSETGELGRELYSHPDADVTGVIYDYSRSVVIGAVYEREGLDKYHHFDSFYALYQRSLARALPGAVVHMVSVSHDRRYFVVVANSSRDPGTYYVLDTQTNTATQVGRVMPWLDPEELARVEALRVASTDGTELDAFVARPIEAGSRPPLVVLPHGGPIDVRDTRTFDPLVQYLAAGGLAVLQVNYRGSSGRGQAFLDAGKRQWGMGIEEDLEAAVDEVVKLGWVDGDRVCVAGGSYGGYSALISVIRNPDRYRCAASLNGPTDLPFLYHSRPYFSLTEEGREYFLEFIGDPESHYEELLAISPAYLASKIRVPVLLVQSTEDQRVDVDHYYRMKTALEALGKPHQAYLIQGAGHSPRGADRIDYVTRLRRFLIQHLEPG